MADAALLDELLRRQARAHGLVAWTDPSPQEDAPDADTRRELAEEAERLTTFAGMRGGVAEADAADGGDDEPLSALAEAAPDAAALEAHGLEALKAELTRLGLKCGGTLAERAARLFALRGRTRLHAEDAALLARPRDAAAQQASRGAKRVARQGPLLPGQQRAKVLKQDS